jgi:hypothetical protein
MKSVLSVVGFTLGMVLVAGCGETILRGGNQTPGSAGSGGPAVAGGGPSGLPAGVRPPARWSGRTAVAPVGPGGSPKAKGFPARPAVPPARSLSLVLTLAWEEPRPGTLKSVSYGWNAAHVVGCERTPPTVTDPKGRLRVTVARPVNGRAQDVTIEWPSHDVEPNVPTPVAFSAAQPQGIAVREETGDTLRSFDDGEPATAFVAVAEIVGGRFRGTFEGRVRGELTGEVFRASGRFECSLVDVPLRP